MGALRIALALSVLMAHSASPGVLIGFGGENAVEGFFLVSGFYIASILNGTYKSKKSFYINRALRIYPMYFIVCGLVLIFRIPMQNGLTELFSFPIQTLIFPTIANATLFGGDLVMFLQTGLEGIRFGNFHNSNPPLYELLWVPQSWSLALELTFYLLAPLLTRLRSRQIVAISLVLISLRIVLYFSGLNSDPWTYRFFPFELPLFLFGIILFRIKSQRFTLNIKYPTQLALVVGAFLVSGLITHFDLAPRVVTLFLTIIIASLLIIGRNQPRIDKKIGEYSYPIYISHLFVFWFTNVLIFHFGIDAISTKVSWLVKFINILITIGLSFFLLLSTKPIEKFRNRIRTQASES